MENAGFLFSAYAIVWAVLFGYVLYLINKQKSVEKELDAIKSAHKNPEGK